MPAHAAQELLRQYPRRKPDLPEPHRRFYAEHIRESRTGANRLLRRVNRLERWMHNRVAACRKPGEHILEIGAGTLNHLPFEQSAGSYDAIEPMESLWRDSVWRSRVRKVYPDLGAVPPENRYDRILSIAVLEHVGDLPRLVASSAMLLRPDGVWQAAIPSEGGFLWGAAWRLTTGLAFRLQRGCSYAPLMRHEHINTAVEVTLLLEWFFAKVSVAQFPFPWRHASFYRYLECRRPNLDRCQAHA
ncbi:MAG: methyltransferase domain-containing protein [Bryobacteraceae bacterium]|nr:methyltransferase domain-containing protein [Bryobacteraceae bacterium]